MKKIAFALSLVALTGLAWADPTASIFVKDAEEFKSIQKELDQLKAGLGQPNAEVDSLWERATRIAKMNDRCAMISINEVLDDECNHFYAVELPEFETKFMEVTGELRLGFMSMGNSLAERTEQIKACASALGGIIVSKEQLVKLDGSVDLEPLTFDGAFDATYDFNLFFDADRMEQQKNMMERWLSKCGEIVLRKAGDEYAPLFLQSVLQINDSLNRSNANLKIVLSEKNLDFWLDLNKPVSGAYYLNGVQLFSVDSIPNGRRYSHLVVNVPKRIVKLPLGKNGKMQNFKGRVEFTSVYQEKNLVGRWTWNSARNQNTSVAKAKGEITQTAAEGTSTEVPLDDSREEVVASAVADVAASGAGNSEQGSSKTRWVVLGISAATAVTGAVLAVAGNSQAKDAAATEKFANQDEFNDARGKAKSGQTLRSVGIGLAIAGAVGIGISFAF
jgi:hypothetical protein